MPNFTASVLKLSAVSHRGSLIGCRKRNRVTTGQCASRISHTFVRYVTGSVRVADRQCLLEPLLWCHERFKPVERITIEVESTNIDTSLYSLAACPTTTIPETVPSVCPIFSERRGEEG